MDENKYANSAEQALNLLRQGEPGTLLVTGNGFDLQCGLNSRYSDFFNWCLKEVKGFSDLKKAIPENYQSQFLIQGAFDNNKELTVWDLYFVHRSELRGSNWCDVEGAISHSFQSGFWLSVLEQINFFQETGRWANSDDENWYFSWMMNERYFYNNNWHGLKIGEPIHSIKILKASEKQFYNCLFTELNTFEKRFGSYIDSEVSGNFIYRRRQINLVNHLISETTNTSKYQVLTFNYTPFLSPVSNLNLHGTTDSPIFGISNTNNKNNDLRAFTKSDRRSHEDLTPLDEFIENKRNFIIFYGVSLNDLDFDYYKMIIKNYGGDKIFFCYSNYDEIDRKREFEDGVINVINQLDIGDFYELRESGRIKILKIDIAP